MKSVSILWIYIVFLVAGGLAGFLKAKSNASLITSVAFAAALSFCALGMVQPQWSADVLLVVLLVFFGLRFAKGKKFMPHGLMTVLTVITLAARQWL